MPLSSLSPSAASAAACAWGNPLPSLPVEVSKKVNPALTWVLHNDTSTKSLKGREEQELKKENASSSPSKGKDIADPHEQQQEQQATTSPATPAPAAMVAPFSPGSEIVKKSQAKDESKSTIKTMDSPVVVKEKMDAGNEEEKDGTPAFKSPTPQAQGELSKSAKKEGGKKEERVEKKVPSPLPTGDGRRSQQAQQPPKSPTPQAQEELSKSAKKEGGKTEEIMEKKAPSPVPTGEGRRPQQAPQPPKQAAQQQQQQEKEEESTPRQASSSATEGGPAKQQQQQQQQKKKKKKKKKKQEGRKDETVPAKVLSPADQAQQPKKGKKQQQKQEQQKQEQQKQEQQKQESTTSRHAFSPATE